MGQIPNDAAAAAMSPTICVCDLVVEATIVRETLAMNWRVNHLARVHRRPLVVVLLGREEDFRAVLNATLLLQLGGE